MTTQDSGQTRPTPREDAAEDDVAAAVVSRDSSSSDIDADVDSILDEIDGVLEVNAEDFVRSFVQKGGQ
ncbi:MAG: ubiquitin-like protein Pup [Actinomycetes bacterium]|jgi:prokaryotic ubiquitin-like protein Pup|nr:ubiquitin-like protein Pup [Candidatus Nanopelagicales bacterium]MDP4824958.1 ubiquitin-like protein Pup [Candidatus Nanopelagicales bacterium]